MKLVVKICLVVTIFVLAFFVMKNAMPFASQNGYYHAVIGSNLFNSNFSISHNLENSIFRNGFIDQHIGFHFLTYALSTLYPLEMCLKILTALVLALSLFILIRKEDVTDAILGFSILTFFIFYNFESFSRLFWERPQIVSIFSFLLFFCAARQKRNWQMAIWAFLLSLISFEVSFWIIFAIFTQSFVSGRNNRFIAFSLLGVALSFFVFPLGLAKVKYFLELLVNNLFFETKIGEWRGISRWSWSGIVTILILFVSFFLPQRLITKKIKILQAAAALFFLFSLKYVRMEYMVSFFIVLISFELIKSMLLKNLKWALSAVLLSSLVVIYPKAQKSFINEVGNENTTAFMNWYLGSPYSGKKFINLKWEFWSSILYADPYTKSEPGYSMLIYKSNQDAYTSYENVRYNTESVGYDQVNYLFKAFKAKYILVDNASKLHRLYKEKKWPLVPLYSDTKVTFYEWHDLNSAYNEYYLNRSVAAACVRNKVCKDGVFSTVAGANIINAYVPYVQGTSLPDLELSRGLFAYREKKTGRLIEGAQIFFQEAKIEQQGLYDVFYEYPFYQIEGVWTYVEKNLISTAPQLFLERINKIFLSELTRTHSKMFYTVGDVKSEDSVNRIRKLGGIESVCVQDKLQNMCLELLRKFDYADLEAWDLGSKASLGLMWKPLAQLFGNEFVEKIFQSVVDHYNPASGNWYVSSIARTEIIGSDGYKFYVGEALTFLTYLNRTPRLSWISGEIQKYMENFVDTKDIYYVRWLSSVLYYDYKNVFSDQNLTLKRVNAMLEEIFKNFYYQYKRPESFSGCVLNRIKANSPFDIDHHSGLLLEGLSYFVNVKEVQGLPLYKELASGFARCTLRQQIQNINRSKFNADRNEVGGIRLEPRYKPIRVDALAHLSSGINLLLKGNFDFSDPR